jgi:hypothetical protein
MPAAGLTAISPPLQVFGGEYPESVFNIVINALGERLIGIFAGWNGRICHVSAGILRCGRGGNRFRVDRFFIIEGHPIAQSHGARRDCRHALAGNNDSDQV